MIGTLAIAGSLVGQLGVGIRTWTDNGNAYLLGPEKDREAPAIHGLVAARITPSIALGGRLGAWLLYRQGDFEYVAEAELTMVSLETSLICVMSSGRWWIAPWFGACMSRTWYDDRFGSTIESRYLDLVGGAMVGVDALYRGGAAFGFYLEGMYSEPGYSALGIGVVVR